MQAISPIYLYRELISRILMELQANHSFYVLKGMVRETN